MTTTDGTLMGERHSMRCVCLSLPSDSSQLNASIDSSSRTIASGSDAPGRSVSETIELFRNAVDENRRQIQESVESAKIGFSVHLGLTLNLSRERLEIIPQEVVDMIKENVERYVKSSNAEDRKPS